MNVVCFRYAPEELDESARDDFNVELLVRVQESGVAVPSNALLDGKFALRVAHTNHRTTPQDFELLVETVVNIGDDLLVQWNEARAEQPARTDAD